VEIIAIAKVVLLDFSLDATPAELAKWQSRTLALPPISN